MSGCSWLLRRARRPPRPPASTTAKALVEPGYNGLLPILGDPVEGEEIFERVPVGPRSVESLLAEMLACLDVLPPEVPPWLADLPDAVVPAFVLTLPFEGRPRAQFEDGHGNVLPSIDKRYYDWIVAVMPVATLYVNALNVREAIELYDAERLADRAPGRLVNRDEA